MNMIKTHEPLRIATPQDSSSVGSYAFPKEVVLYEQDILKDGSVLYLAYFWHKGQIAQEELKPDDKEITPGTLYNLSADESKNLFNRFPLSKQDLLLAVKASGITRDELIDILRHLDDKKQKG